MTCGNCTPGAGPAAVPVHVTGIEAAAAAAIGTPAPAPRIRRPPRRLTGFTKTCTAASPIQDLVPLDERRLYIEVRALDNDVIVCTDISQAQDPANVAAGPGLVEPANPPAGSGYTYVIPGPLPTQLQSATATLVTSATAGNRTLRLEILDGSGNLLAQIAGSGSVPASSTLTATWSLGLGTQGSATSGQSSSELMNFPLQAGWQVAIVVTGEQAGDQLSAIALNFTATGPGYPNGILVPHANGDPERIEGAGRMWVVSANYPARVAVKVIHEENT